jgi:5-methylcytosine-specific restriction endonuclease McrA
MDTTDLERIAEIGKKADEMEYLYSDYKAQLLRPEWQRKRLEILTRDDFTCAICESQEKTLHVHHTFYSEYLLAWQYPTKTLITVCCDCHKTYYHKIKSNG